MERTIWKGVHPSSENMFLKEESISLAHAYMMGWNRCTNFIWAHI
jgi:hypothetical protein